MRTTSELDLSAATSSHRFQYHFSPSATSLVVFCTWRARFESHCGSDGGGGGGGCISVIASTAIIFYLGPFPFTLSQLCILFRSCSLLRRSTCGYVRWDALAIADRYEYARIVLCGQDQDSFVRGPQLQTVFRMSPD
jgi:hypothetical protein